MQRTGTLTAICLVLTLGCPAPQDRSVSGGPKSGRAEELVREIKIKLKLPTEVDDNTRLDDVRALSETEVGYFLTLTRTSETEDGKPLAGPIEAMLRAQACENPSYTQLFEAGLSLRMTYQKDQVEIARIKLTPSDCGH